MKKVQRIIETYEEFIKEASTGGAAYPTAVDPSSTKGIGTQNLELLMQAGQAAVNIENHKVWDALVKAVDDCRDEIITKLKQDGHKIWQDSTRLTKEFIDAYGQDYVATYLISRLQP